MNKEDQMTFLKQRIFESESSNKINEDIAEEYLLELVKEIEDRKKLLKPSSFRST